MNLIAAFFNSSVGKKWVVALTGLVMVGFVVGHLVGNLQVFAGPEKINAYAAFLKGLGGALWAMRGFLVLCLVLHVFTTLKLVAENRAARPERYAKPGRVQSKLSTRMMALSGLTILCFVVFHLLHYTTVSVVPAWKNLHYQLASDGRTVHDVYAMMILGFRNPLASGFYIVAMLLLGLHLAHGIESVFQTLGLRTKTLAPQIAVFSRLAAVALVVGYVSIPVAVMAGLGKCHLAKIEVPSCCEAPAPAAPAAPAKADTKEEKK